MNGIFLDWEKVFKLKAAKVYSLGLVIALMSSGIGWWLWGQGFYRVQQSIELEIEQSQQKQHLLLTKLLKLDQLNYELDYKALVRSFPKDFSKREFLGFLTTDVNDAQLTFKQWQWQEDGNTYVLFMEVEGPFSSITSLLQAVLSYTDLAALTKLNLVRESLEHSMLLGQFEVEFYIRPELGTQE